jgi:hypothetical protein
MAVSISAMFRRDRTARSLMRRQEARTPLTRPMRAACFATIFSSTDPIHLRSCSPSITFELMNQIARSLPLAHLQSGAGTYFC